MSQKVKYDIESPDGITIDPFDIYNTPEHAWIAFEIWAKQFEKQGYYSSNNGRIPLDQLKSHCKLIPIPQ